MTIAEKLAAARGDAGSAPADNGESTQVTDEVEDVAAVDSATDEATDGETATAEDAAVEAVDRDNMSVDEMVAWCRKHDG